MPKGSKTSCAGERQHVPNRKRRFRSRGHADRNSARRETNAEIFAIIPASPSPPPVPRQRFPRKDHRCAMTCALSFSSSASSSPSGVSWKIADLHAIADAADRHLINPDSSIADGAAQVERRTDRREPLKSRGTSSMLRPLSDGE